MNLQDLVTAAMWALNDSWLSRTTPRFFAVGVDVTVALSMEMVSSCIGQDLAGTDKAFSRPTPWVWQ